MTVTKKEADGEHPAGHYLVVENPDQPSTWHLRVRAASGEVDHGLMGAAWAALHGGYRGNRYEGPGRGEAISKLTALYRSEGMETPRSISAGEAPVPRFAVNLAALNLSDAASELVRVPLFKLGRYVQGKTRFAITRADGEQIVSNFLKRANRELVIDYEHASEMAPTGGPVIAGGWLKEIESAPCADGVWWGKAEFTERARELIRNREYKYLSPVIAWGRRDKQSGDPQGATLTSMALTNAPFLEAMPAIQLSDRWSEEITTETQARKEKRMETKITLSEGGQAAVVCGECGKETNAAVQVPQPKVVRLSDVKRTKDGRYDFAAIESGGVLVASEVFAAQQAQAALDEAVAAGKITPAQRPHYEKLALSDLAGFRELMATMKQQVDLSERGIAGSGEEAGPHTELARVDAEISKLVEAKRAADTKLSYGQAMKVVLDERQDLRERRSRAMRLA